MPWKEIDKVTLKREFVRLALNGGASISELCRRFGISRKTGYKWLGRYAEQGDSGLADQAKVPTVQPTRTSDDVEQLVLACRDRYPDWGGRKLKRVLEDAGHKGIPSKSTVTQILRRHGRLETTASTPHRWIRFEHPHPNDLWQMDFKGYFLIGAARCHSLTVLDDCSRYSMCLQACDNQQTETVKQALIDTFRRFGLPRRMTMDNGPPWGGGGTSRFTRLTVWLIEQGITVGHSRPYHPQTQGKDERFHRTLGTELIGRRTFDTFENCQGKFCEWQERYNWIRPHEALGMATPGSRYEVSMRAYQEHLPEYEYGLKDRVRKVSQDQTASFQNYNIAIGEAFTGKRVAFRPTLVDGVYRVVYQHQEIKEVDMREIMSTKTVRNKRKSVTP